MTLFDDGIGGPPSIYDYEAREKILPSERCEACDGFGRIRWTNSNDAEHDWRRCYSCDGSGRKMRKKQ